MRSIAWIAVLLFVLPFVFGAASIQGPSPDALLFQFSPGAHYVIPFYIGGADVIATSIEGEEIGQYAILHDPQAAGGPPRDVKVEFTLPDELAPGEYTFFLMAIEKPPEGQMLGGIAAVKRRIRILSLYPEPLARIESFQISDADINASSTDAAVVVKSLSKPEFPVSAHISLFETNGTPVTAVETNRILLASGTTASLTAKLPIRGLPPGTYLGRAELRYDGNESIAETPLRIGTMDFELVAYQDVLVRGRINPFTLTAANRWNQDVGNVRATVDLGDASERTPSAAAGKFSTAELKTFFDMTDAAEGTIDGTVHLLWDGGAKDFPISVRVVNETMPEAATVPIEEPAKRPWLLYGLYAGLILLVLLNLFFIFRRKRKDEDAPLEAPRMR